jgi:hypothetical protein
LRDVDKCLQANITALEHCGQAWTRGLSIGWGYEENINAKMKPYIAKFQAIQLRFRDLREEAKALRDGVSLPIANCKTIHINDGIETAFQRKLRHGKPSLDTSRRECQTIDIREHFLLAFILLHGMSPSSPPVFDL